MAVDLAEELTLKFGPANGDGVFLVGVVDVLPDAGEGVAHGRTVMCIRRIVSTLGFGRVGEPEIRHDDYGAYVDLVPGVTVAVTWNLITEGQESIGRARIPTPGEQSAWLDANPPSVRDEESDRAWWSAGFRESEAEEWREVMPRLLRQRNGVEATEQQLRELAVTWRVSGFSAPEAREWCDTLGRDLSGPSLAHAARDWRDRGFTAEEASRWAGSWPWPGESPEAAQMLRDLGWNPFEVWLLNEFIDREANPDFEHARRMFAQMEPAHALDMARAGMTPADDSGVFGDLVDPEWDGDWEQVLRRFYARRTPIDPYVAMHINHHIWLYYGEEIPDDDVPFRHERIWDLHNQAAEKDERAGRIPTNGVPPAVRPTGGKSPATPPQSARKICPGSGGRGRMLERDGWDEWRIECPECGASWGGGAVEPLDEHFR